MNVSAAVSLRLPESPASSPRYCCVVRGCTQPSLSLTAAVCLQHVHLRPVKCPACDEHGKQLVRWPGQPEMDCPRCDGLVWEVPRG